jgi:hypothetical protein
MQCGRELQGGSYGILFGKIDKLSGFIGFYSRKVTSLIIGFFFQRKKA